MNSRRFVALAGAALLAATAVADEGPACAESDFAGVDKVDVARAPLRRVAGFRRARARRRVPRADDQRQLRGFPVARAAACRRGRARARLARSDRLRGDIRRGRQRAPRLARGRRARAGRRAGARRRRGEDLEGRRHAAARCRRARGHDRRSPLRPALRVAPEARRSGTRTPGRASKCLAAARADDDPWRSRLLRGAPAVPHGCAPGMAVVRAAGCRARPRPRTASGTALRRRSPRLAGVGRRPHRRIPAPLPECERRPRGASLRICNCRRVPIPRKCVDSSSSSRTASCTARTRAAART